MKTVTISDSDNRSISSCIDLSALNAISINSGRSSISHFFRNSINFFSQAYVSTIAVLFNFILQITAFVALLSLDEERYENNRLDMLCCIKMDKIDKTPKVGFLYNLWANYYTPFVMKLPVRYLILLIFTVTLSLSIMVIPTIELGLDQELSMSEDSHVLKYLQFMKALMNIGAPVYWVTKGSIDYFNPEIMNRACSGVGCSEHSISTQLYMASTQSNMTYLAVQANSWLDDLNDWSDSENCCSILNQIVLSVLITIPLVYVRHVIFHV
uniref:Niemann-Pick C1-like protein 1 n=1 Tax=Anoplophora glabripennis TaxID=217634 RepID=V5GQT7_ANOGL